MITRKYPIFVGVVPLVDNQNVPVEEENSEKTLFCENCPHMIESSNFIDAFWSNVDHTREEKRGWWRRNFVDPVKRCYTPGNEYICYKSHRLVEDECVQECPPEKAAPSPAPRPPPCPPVHSCPPAHSPCPPQATPAPEKEKLKEKSQIALPCPPHCTQKMRSVFCCFTKLITTTFQIVAIGAAIYYGLKWWYLRQEYKQLVQEVREAQNERILLENELVKMQNDPNDKTAIYDEIDDTKRQIMITEIERISQYLMQAKAEIAALIEEKENLKLELRHAERERDEAKLQFESTYNREASVLRPNSPRNEWYQNQA